MSRPMDFNLARGNLSALEALTVDRKYNRGTLEVVKSQDGGEIVGLKCSRHKLLSRSISTMNQTKVHDLVEFMKETIDRTLDDIGAKLIEERPQDAEAVNRKVRELKNAFRGLVEVRKNAAGELQIGNLKPLGRNEIKTIVMGLKGLQERLFDDFCAVDSGALAKFASGYEALKKAKALVHGATGLEDIAKKGIRRRNDQILTKLESRKYVNDCGGQDFGLVDLRNAPAGENAKVSAYTFEDVFSTESGSVSGVAYKLHKQGKKCCTLVRGDTTYNGGMLLGGKTVVNRKTKRKDVFSGYTSQEETVVRNLNPASTAYLFAKGYLGMRKTGFGVQFEYLKNSDGTRKLSPPDGFMMKGRFESVNEVVKKNSLGFDTDLLYAAMPPLNIREEAADIGGCVYYAGKCVKLLSGREVSAEERANSEKFFTGLLPELRKTFGVGKEGVAVGKRIMKAALFLSEEFNVFGNDEERAAGIRKLLDHFVADRSGGGLYAQADENYEKVVGDRIDTWVRNAVERGDDVFLGSDIGCGVFGNDSEAVGRLFGAAFAKYGAKMKFVYQEGNSDTEVLRRQRFEAGFKAGFNAELSREVRIPEDPKSLGTRNGYDGRNTTGLEKALGDLRDVHKVFAYTLNYVSRSLCIFDDDEGRTRYLDFLKSAKRVLVANTIARGKEMMFYLGLVNEAEKLLPEGIREAVKNALGVADGHLKR